MHLDQRAPPEQLDQLGVGASLDTSANEMPGHRVERLDHLHRRPIPAGAYNVAAQLLAVEAGVDHHQPSARVHLTSGVWMTLRAARVDASRAPGEQDIAVSIEPASPTERRTLFARSHALSPGETALVEHLAHGADTRNVAQELFLSEHTVQDHLKSIFAKTGARNRRTLLTRLSGG
jgi:DNA-binding CsgD family transcriptional regulator